MLNDIREILISHKEPFLLSRFLYDKKYSLNSKNGQKKRITFLLDLRKYLIDYLEFEINNQNGKITILSSLDKLNKFYENEKTDIVLTKVREYALLHDTHSKRIEDIRPKNSYFLYKDFIEQKVKVIDNDFSNKRKLIIVENQLIFDLNKEEFLTYLKNFDFQIDEDTIILFGSGNKVNSSKLVSLLNEFEEISYFADYDEEGYKIFKNLKFKSKKFIFPTEEVFLNIQSEIKCFRDKFNEVNYNCEGKEQAILKKDNSLFKLLGNKFNYSEEIYVMNQEVFLNF